MILTPRASLGYRLFSQQALPLLLETAALEGDSRPPYPPSLLNTGATASLRGGAGFAAVAAGAFAARSSMQVSRHQI